MSKSKTVVADPRTQAQRVLERMKVDHGLVVPLSELATIVGCMARGQTTPELPGGLRGTLIEREVAAVRDRDGGNFALTADELAELELGAEVSGETVPRVEPIISAGVEVEAEVKGDASIETETDVGALA